MKKRNMLAVLMAILAATAGGAIQAQAAITGMHAAKSTDEVINLNAENLVVSSDAGVHHVALYAANGGTINMNGSSITMDTPAESVGAATAENDGTINLTNVDIATGASVGSGNKKMGLFAHGGNINMSGGSIQTEQYDAFGVWATSGGKVVLENSVDIQTSGGNGMGLRASNGDSQISMTGGTITLEGAGESSSHNIAVFSEDGGKIDIDGVMVETKKEYAHGLVASSSSSYEGSTLTAQNTTVVTAGTSSMGAIAADKSTLTMVGNSVTTGGKSAYGLYTYNDGNADLQDSKIVTKGSNAIGVYAYNSGTATLRDSHIVTNGSDSDGIYALNGGVEMHGGSVTTTNSASYGVFARRRGTANLTDTDIKTMREYSTGVEADFNGKVSLTGGSVHTLGKGSHGVGTAQGGVAELSDFDILTEGDASHGVIAKRDGNVVLKSGGRVEVKQQEESYALYSQAYGNGNITGEDGQYIILGDVVNEGYDSKIDISFIDGSVFTGGTRIKPTDPSKAGVIDYKMTGDAYWNMTKNSDLTSLTLNRGNTLPTVDMKQDGNAFGTLTMETLSGTGGNFAMDVNVPTMEADRVIVTESTAGNHVITIANDGAANTTGDERTILVETANKGGIFVLANGKVEAGAWMYGIRNMNDGSGRYDDAEGQYWELYRLSDSVDPSDPSDPGSSAPGSASVNTFIGNYYLNYAETDTLMKRLGELRGDMQHSKHGAWFRGFGGKMESTSGNYVRGFEMDYWGVQVGYDNLLDREKSWFKNGDTYVGGFIGVSKGDMDFDKINYGKGDLEHRTMGMYWTYLHDTGYYFDAIAKYVWSKNDFDVYDSAGTPVQGGKINTGGVGMSLETGKRFRLGGEAKRPTGEKGNWYLEPQAQLSWQHFGSGTFRASNGLRIGVNSYDSLIGRLGLLVGYERGKTNIYGKVSYLKEFDGEMMVHANDVLIPETLDDSWWVYGIGIAHQVNPRNALYLDIETSSGGDFEDKWRISGGWRISL